MGQIIDHTIPSYQERWEKSGLDKYNGAYYYSIEIVKNIIPRVNTDRNWVTVNQPGKCLDHSIVFIHNNKYPEHYEWLKDYKDLVLVCGVPSTVEKVKHIADHAIYLPLSIDIEDVMRYQQPKTKDAAFVGRIAKLVKLELPMGCEVLSGFPREQILKQLGAYRTVYAVGRCAIEARALGCEIGVYDPRFPDPSIWQVIDNKEAAKMLQEQLNKIDIGGK